MNSLLINLARKVASALTSDLFDVLLPLLRGTNLTFWEKLLLAPRDKTVKLANLQRQLFSEIV
jgi:hypothetical protein